jgi:cytidylate kinase
MTSSHPSGREDRQGLPETIAIDGPAGAGKSTIGRLLAQKLGYLFLDTGVMYRAVALEALRRGISTTNQPTLAEVAETLPIQVRMPSDTEDDGRLSTVLVNGEDITWEIRRPEVEAVVSQIAAHPSVRHALVRQQRRLAKRGPVVMVGRDITTEVLPDADLKIYLDASLEERARRRYEELQERGRQVSYKQVEAEIAHRDDLDMHRAAGALRQADDALRVFTDGHTVDQTLEKILEIVQGGNVKRET